MQLLNTIFHFSCKLSGCVSLKVGATSSGSPKILISYSNIVYMYGSLRQGIEPFHFPVVILFYQLVFTTFGIYQLITFQPKPYHSYRFHSLRPLSQANDFDHQLLFLTAIYHQLFSYVLIWPILVFVQFFSIFSYCRDLVFQKIQEVASQLLTSLPTYLKVKWQVHLYTLQCFQWLVVWNSLSSIPLSLKCSQLHHLSVLDPWVLSSDPITTLANLIWWSQIL